MGQNSRQTKAKGILIWINRQLQGSACGGANGCGLLSRDGLSQGLRGPSGLVPREQGLGQIDILNHAGIVQFDAVASHWIGLQQPARALITTELL